MSMDNPEVGDRWMDPDRNMHRVVGVGLRHSTSEQFVVLREDAHNDLRVCPLSEFLETFGYVRGAL